jgi:alkylhydroperoxidase family enzyme
MDRIRPLEAPFTPEVEARLTAMMPPGVPPIALFRTFAHHLPMAEAMGPWGRHQLGRGFALSRREREIVIDRTCARCGCEYEWGVHVLMFGAKAGLSRAQVASLTFGGPADPCWTSPRERLLIRVADELQATGDVGDALWTDAAAALDVPELLDLLMLSGWYRAISATARAARVPLEDAAPRFADYAP